jgi:hypothetical protein
MRGLLVGLALLALLGTVHVSGYSNDTCPSNRHIVSVGVFPAMVYVEYYGDVPDPTGTTYVYVESGARPDLQVGRDEVLLGPTYGHEVTCVWPQSADWDYLVY